MAGDEVYFHFDGLSEWQTAVDEMIARTTVAAREVVTLGGHIIEAAAKERAPVVTGTLRRSIAVTKVQQLSIDQWLSETGPTTAYGRRIELGFHGADSLGRVYNQAGQPYFGPAVEDSMPAVETLYYETFAKAIGV
jgi:hypothetical protein